MQIQPLHAAPVSLSRSVPCGLACAKLAWTTPGETARPAGSSPSAQSRTNRLPVRGDQDFPALLGEEPALQLRQYLEHLLGSAAQSRAARRRDEGRVDQERIRDHCGE